MVNLKVTSSIRICHRKAFPIPILSWSHPDISLHVQTLHAQLKMNGKCLSIDWSICQKQLPTILQESKNGYSHAKMKPRHVFHGHGSSLSHRLLCQCQALRQETCSKSQCRALTGKRLWSTSKISLDWKRLESWQGKRYQLEAGSWPRKWAAQWT